MNGDVTEWRSVTSDMGDKLSRTNPASFHIDPDAGSTSGPISWGQVRLLRLHFAACQKDLGVTPRLP